MKSLWIVNKNCGALHLKNFGKESTGGLWLDAMLNQVKQSSDDQVVVINIEKKPKTKYLDDGRITYYTLKGNPNYNYDYKSECVIQQWKTIIEKEKPDIIELWGTEFPYGLAAMNAAPDIPVIVFIQGILESISRYYKAGMTNEELKKAISLRDILTHTRITQIQRCFSRRALYEKEILIKAKNIIVENTWAKSYCQRLAHDINAYYLPISITESFKNRAWNNMEMEQNTIMCSAANYPIKGLHMLLKALALVKIKYPDVRLYIPGTKLNYPKTIKERLRIDGYSKYILSMIDKLNLKNNIIYLGRLTADEMAKKMSEVNCFVMSSAIENHSSTLKEAMTVGVPCVASYVGGIPEYALNGENCLLYRFEDYEVLANNIVELFGNEKLCRKLSDNARNDMTKKEVAGYAEMRKIFEQCLMK